MSDDGFNIPKPPPLPPKPKVNSGDNAEGGSVLPKPSMPAPPQAASSGIPTPKVSLNNQSSTGNSLPSPAPVRAKPSMPAPVQANVQKEEAQLSFPASQPPQASNPIVPPVAPKIEQEPVPEPMKPAANFVIDNEDSATPTVKPAAQFIIDDDEDYIAQTGKPSATIESTFQTSEPEVDEEPGLFIPQNADFEVSDEVKQADAEIVEDYSPDYYDDDNVDYYSETGSNLVISRGNIFGKIFKPVAWIGLAAGIVSAGVFSAPYIADWFTETFSEQMSNSATTEPSEVITEAIVEGEAENVPVVPSTPTGEYNPEITFSIMGEISSGDVVPQGSAAIVPYVNQPAGDSPSKITIQLDTIERTEEFGPTLREVKIASVGDAVAQGISQEEIEAQTENYRMSLVKITMQYDGEPQTFNVPQNNLTFFLGDAESSIVNDTSQNVLAYYVNNLGYSISDGEAEILKDHQCDISKTLPASFWEGEPVQKCFITASNGPFNSVKYVNSGFEATLEYSYVE